jgi:hypothetical protein
MFFYINRLSGFWDQSQYGDDDDGREFDEKEW